LLARSIGTESTIGACFYACILLCEVVNRFTTFSAIVRGGDGQGDGGFVDSMGQWHGHYWVEATSSPGLGWVLDITADQFGGLPVVVQPLKDARHQYTPGDQATVNEHLNEFGITD